MPPYLYAIYCDDVREEVGGKHTFVGVYHRVLFLPELPLSIPKLCVAVFLHAVEKRPEDVTIEVQLGQRLLGRHTMQKDDRAPWEDRQHGPFEFSVLFNLSPLVVSEPGVMTVRATYDGKELFGPELSILARCADA